MIIKKYFIFFSSKKFTIISMCTLRFIKKHAHDRKKLTC